MPTHKPDNRIHNIIKELATIGVSYTAYSTALGEFRIDRARLTTMEITGTALPDEGIIPVQAEVGMDAFSASVAWAFIAYGIIRMMQKQFPDMPS